MPEPGGAADRVCYRSPLRPVRIPAAGRFDARASNKNSLLGAPDTMIENLFARRLVSRKALLIQAAALCMCSTTAMAALVDSGPVNIAIPDTADGIYFNVVTGASGTTGGSVAGWDVNPYSAIAGQFNLWGPSANTWFNPQAVISGIYNLPGGTVIQGAAAAFFRPGSTNVASQFTLNSNQNYVGFRFVNEANASQVHFGYLQLQFGATAATRSIVRYVYDNVANTAVVIPGGATAPTLSYTPTTAAGVTFPGGGAGSVNASIAISSSGAAGTGQSAVTGCAITGPGAASFGAVTTTPANGIFNTGTTSGSINLSCTRGGAVANASLACTETATPSVPGSPFTRTWALTCPAASATNADLSVVLTDTPDPVTAGTNLSYTATVANAGGDSASDVAVTVAVPAGTTFVSSNAPGGSCTGTGPVVCTWAGATAVGVNRVATVVVAVPANAVSGSLLSSSASVTSATPDANPGNNSSSAGTGVITDANLSMALVDSPDPVVAGAQLSYTATLSNGGPSDAQNARFSVSIPAGTTFVSATPTGGSCSGTTTVTCTWAGATAPGASRSAVIVVGVPAATSQGTVLTANANATSDTPDAVPGNNGAGATTTVNAVADLAITLTDSPDPVTAGNQLTYTATLSNAGLSDADNASITLPLPAGTSFVSAAASAGGSCNSASPVVCTWGGPTAVGVNRTATIVALVSPSQVAALSATATAGSGTTDPVPGNNTATAGTVVQVVADLSIALTDAPDPVTAGTQLTYTATVTNAGPSDATAVVVSLPTPTGTSFVSGTVSGGGSCAAGISCSIGGSMAPGSSRTVSITVLVGAAVLDGTAINATATVSAGSPDPNSANNSASTTTAVIARADLSVTLTSSVAQVLINVPVSFTAISTNGGPSDAQNVSVTVTLTPDFRYSSHTATGATCTTPQIGNTGAIVCTWSGATAPGASRTLTVVAYSNNEGNTAVNASTTSATVDPVANNNAASVSVVVGFPFNEIPTLSQYGLLLLALLVGLVGFVAVRRQG